MLMSEDKDDVHIEAVGEASRQPQGTTSASAWNWRAREPRAYLNLVKNTFRDDKQKFNEFLKIINKIKAWRTDRRSVIPKVKELFKGHPVLIVGLNHFLPMGYEIALTSEGLPAVRPFRVAKAIKFVDKMKLRFIDDDELRTSFYKTMQTFRNERNKSREEFCREIAVVFEGHADLLEEFKTFYTPSTAAAPL